MGKTGIAWSYEDPSAAAKVVKAFRKDERRNEKLAGQGGVLDGQGPDGARRSRAQLATMPGKDELRAMLLATLQAPLSSFVHAAQRACARTSSTCSTRRKQREGSEG